MTKLMVGPVSVTVYPTYQPSSGSWAYQPSPKLVIMPVATAGASMSYEYVIHKRSTPHKLAMPAG